MPINKSFRVELVLKNNTGFCFKAGYKSIILGHDSICEIFSYKVIAIYGMKRIFTSAFLILAGAAASYAQEGRTQDANPNIAAMNNRPVIAGSFEIDKTNSAGKTEHINVNYAISPVPFTNVLNLELNTPNPTFFRAEIINAQGKKVAQWSPAQKSYLYKGTMDISSLPKGNYKVNIYSELAAGVVNSIPFQKK